MSKHRKPPGLIHNNPPHQPTVVAQQEITVHSGPLPSPEVLQAFENILPGLANRITALAEGNARDRWATNHANRIRTLLGPIFAFIAALTIFVGSFYLILAGHGGVGLATLIAEIAALVSAFIYGRRHASS